jgi:hypothetical protein
MGRMISDLAQLVIVLSGVGIISLVLVLAGVF